MLPASGFLLAAVYTLTRSVSLLLLTAPVSGPDRREIWPRGKIEEERPSETERF